MDLKESSATFSPCKKYRYSLTRIWDDTKKLCVFICLNPSTADDIKNDNTVTRCIKYSKKWGYGGFVMLNIFAFRATDPKEMKAFPEPIGPDNDQAIIKWCSNKRVGKIICGWGNHGLHIDRQIEIAKILKGFNTYCLKLTKQNQPGHPLYLKANLKPIPYRPNEK